LNIASDTRNRLREEYSIKDSDVVFAFIGRVTPSKGIAELIEAFSRLVAKYNNIKLIVVGADWFSSSTESEYIKKLQLSSISIKDRIIFTGYVDYNRIAEQYACADVVVVPSIKGEACGLVVLEAMAAGKALIVSDSGGISEYANLECAIEVARGADFVEGLTNAMEKLILDRILLKKMGEQGRLRSSAYDKDDYLSRLIELIEA
jgi:glycosyltransferase involved in cell wall biosynthesis